MNRRNLTTVLYLGLIVAAFMFWGWALCALIHFAAKYW